MENRKKITKKYLLKHCRIISKKYFDYFNNRDWDSVSINRSNTISTEASKNKREEELKPCKCTVDVPGTL